jgi:hypothetical protein
MVIMVMVIMVLIHDNEQIAKLCARNKGGLPKHAVMSYVLHIGSSNYLTPKNSLIMFESSPGLVLESIEHKMC